MERVGKSNLDENKNGINPTIIADQFINEKNLFNLIALFGKNNLKNILTYYPGFKYSKIFTKFLKIFEDYNNCNTDINNNNYKSLKIVEKIVKRFDAEFPLSNLIDNLF